MSESDSAAPQFVMSPSEAARRLGVAPSTLRRLAPTYEAVHGKLPWEGDEAGGGRLWPSEAVERVETARALVAEGRAKSLESALRALAGGAPPPSGLLSRSDGVGELVEALRSELEAVRRGLAEIPELRAEVAALRSELAEARALPPGATPERIDRALEVEMLESIGASENPTTVEDRHAGVEVVNGVEPQRLEQESWMAAVALKTLAAASELSAAPREGREGGKSPGEASSEAEGASDGLMVRAARWLEQRLRGGQG